MGARRLVHYRRVLAGFMLSCFITGGLGSGLFAIAALGGSSGRLAPVVAAALLPGYSSTGSELDPQGRVTVLVLGVDRRPVEAPDTPSRTDTILLLSVDSIRQTASALSIPRDLWVPIPLAPDRVVLDRINSAYVLGEQTSYPGGGAALAKATVEYNLGVRVHRYLLLDFEAFERFIDAIGGVDLTLADPLVDPAFPTADYGAIPIRIAAGRQHLNGERALWLARSRYQSSDFSRMRRQQQLLLAVRARLLQPELVPQWPRLWVEHSRFTKTDLTFSETFQLARTVLDIPPQSVTARSLEVGYVYRGAVPGDPFVLFPDRPRIGQLVAQLFPDTDQ